MPFRTDPVIKPCNFFLRQLVTMGDRTLAYVAVCVCPPSPRFFYPCPLQVIQGHDKVAELLLHRGADPTSCDDRGDFILYYYLSYD